MNKNKLLALICVLAGTSILYAGEVDSMPARYYQTRVLGGLKIKLADNFTAGIWAARYTGNSYFPKRLYVLPIFAFQGYDVVPGLQFDCGTLFSNVKLAVGGDFYYSYRNWDWSSEGQNFTARPRANIIITTPIGGNFKMTAIQRIERFIIRSLYGGENWVSRPGYLMLRTTLKLETPQYSPWKISPYALYEGFTTPSGIEYYYYEAEFGVSLSPVKGVSLSFADQIQSQPERVNWETHQFCVYAFYTIDVASMFKKQ